MADKITIAISGMNATDNPGPGSGIARSLKESSLDVKIIGLAYDSMEPGIVMDWLIDKSYILPYPSNNSSFYLNRLKYIIETEKIDIIIPALDVELPFFIKKEKEITSLQNGNCKVMLPTEKALEQVSKKNLQMLAEKMGFYFPESKNIFSLEQLQQSITKFNYPIVIKGLFYEAKIAYNYHEALQSFNEFSYKWGYPIIVQKFIKGSEYNFVGLGDGKGESLGHIMVKKVMVTKQGKIWSNVSIINEDLKKASDKMLDYTHWHGGYEIEALLEEKTNQFYLLEINPRFPSWIYLSAANNVNLPERLIMYLMNIKFSPTANYEAGKMLIRYTGEIIKDINNINQISVVGET